ncbi:MAG: hypothetical protein WA622_17025 [Mycobacterium sp.]|uniref:hypothetical protein n=1 Tax=Mycobacterium sp. TaxID=1785 RepID=UPI003CA998BA
MTDPIDRLVAEIDKLIDEELARGPRDGEVGQAICALCGGDWHGAPADADTAGEHRRTANCPGAFATAEQREHWLRPRHRREPLGCGKSAWTTDRASLDGIELNVYVEGLRQLGCGALLSADRCEFCGRGPSGHRGMIRDCPWAYALRERLARRSHEPGCIRAELPLERMRRICLSREWLD